MKPIVIVGAGITGAVIARELGIKGYSVILVEKGPEAGGLAKTFRYGDFSFDIGPHRFFSQKQEILDFIKGVLKNNYMVIPRHSEVYFYGKYHPWPLKPTVLFRLPAKILLRSCCDLLFMLIKRSKEHHPTFEDYILTNYGPSLYNAFFKDYTEKFLGIPAKEIHSDWAKEGMKRTIIDESIASRNLFDILKLFFIFRPHLTEFIYPNEGIGVFTQNLMDEIQQNKKAEVMLNASITRINHSSSKIEEIEAGGTKINPGLLIWTGSLKDACRLLEVPHQGLEYLSIILFNIRMREAISRNYQWCYYGSKDIVFNRVTIPGSFSKYMVPQNQTSLCVEVTCRQNDGRWLAPNILLEQVKKDLIKVGLIKRISDIQEVQIERIPDAYPVYLLDYTDNLKRVIQELKKFDNIVLGGRTGLFWYNNMDDSIENALQIAAQVSQRYPEP